MGKHCVCLSVTGCHGWVAVATCGRETTSARPPVCKRDASGPCRARCVTQYQRTVGARTDVLGMRLLLLLCQQCR